MDCSGHLCAAPEKCLSTSSYPLLLLFQECLWPSSQPLHPILRRGVTDRLSPQWPSSDPIGVYIGLINNSGWQVSRGKQTSSADSRAGCNTRLASHCSWGSRRLPAFQVGSELGARGHACLQKLCPWALRVLRVAVGGLSSPQRMES